MTPLRWVFTIVVLAIVNIIADVAAKDQRPVTATLVYAGAGVAWAVLLGRNDASLSHIVILYGIINYIIGTIAGIILFDEHLSPINWVGFGLGLVSLVLVSWQN